MKFPSVKELFEKGVHKKHLALLKEVLCVGWNGDNHYLSSSL
jgi:hypothetical protein